MTESGCSLVRRFATLARRAPATPILFDADGRVAATRAALACRIQALAGNVSRSVRPGSVAVLSLGNGPDFIVAFAALRALGAVVLLVDATAPRDDLARCATAVGATAILADESRLPVVPQQMLGELALAKISAPPINLPRGTAVLKLTSGSTGEPRAVAVDVGGLVRDTVQILRTMALTPADITLAAIPLTHSYGVGSCLVPLFLVGMPLAFPTCALPAALAHTLVEARVSHFPAVPAMVRALARLPNMPDLPLLRVCLSAGAPLAPEDAAAFYCACTVKVHSFYGTSECGGISYDRSREPVKMHGMVGTAMEGVEIEILDGAGHPMTSGGEGRVRVRSRAAAIGIVPSDEDGALGPGRFLTPDLGRLDDTGRLTLIGRIGDVINVAGKKVQAEEVRRIIEAVPGVRAARVVGIPGAHRGQVVAAVVAVDTSAGVDSERIMLACRTRLAAYKWPRRLVLLDELPVSERGKVRQEALLALLTPRQAKE